MIIRLNISNAAEIVPINKKNFEYKFYIKIAMKNKLRGKQWGYKDSTAEGSEYGLHKKIIVYMMRRNTAKKQKEGQGQIHKQKMHNTN